MALFPLVVLVGIVALALGGPSQPPSLAAFVIFMSVLMVLMVAFVANWRCPVCGGYLGRGFWGIFSVCHCLRCGAALR